MKTNLSSTSISALEKSQNSNTEHRSVSPCSSPRGSPKPSPRPQTKRDHTKSDFLTVNYTKEQGSLKQDGSPSSQESGSRVSQESGSRERLSNTSIEVTPPSQDTISVLGKDKRERTKKKSSWFNSFYPTYKSRSEDFKKLFKKVPDDERLVVDYSCALQKEILVQGRIYVTQNYLCFHANIFGWETNLTIKWKDVASIAKEKTALVIPNAILISTKSDRYFFTSFVSRDKTYVMLFRVWQNALMDQPMSPQEMWQWVHQSYGSELGLTSDDEDYIAPIVEEEKLSARLSVDSFPEEARGIIDAIMDPDRDGDETGILGSKISGSESHLPTDATDNSESDHDKVLASPPKKKLSKHSFSKSFSLPTPDSDDPDTKTISENVQCTANHDGKHILDVVLPINIDQLFTLLFTSSKFYLDFHAARKTTDLTQTPWTHNPIDNSKSRIVSLTMTLGQTVGPKSAQVTETQVMLPCSKAGHLYAIDLETINAGVPYADSFVVLVHYCIKKVSDTQSSLNVYAQIKYKKSVWGLVKGMIERNCFSGMEDYINHLSRALAAEGDNVSEVKRKSRRKRRLYNLPRSPSEEISPTPLLRRKSQNAEGIFSSDACTLIVFSVLLLLLLLNIMLYYKLWSLEETPAYSLLDLQILKNPPKNHEEWLQLVQKQETLHNIEAIKWQKLLKNAIDHLKQAEESLIELKRSIESSHSNKLSIIQNEQKVENVVKEL